MAESATTGTHARAGVSLQRVGSSRPLRMMLIIGALWMTNLFDVGLTLMAHAQSVLHEMNPVGIWLLGLGPPAVLLFKLVMVLVATSLLWRVRRHPLAELAALLGLLAYVLVSLRWRAYYETYAALGDLSLFSSSGPYLL